MNSKSRVGSKQILILLICSSFVAIGCGRNRKELDRADFDLHKSDQAKAACADTQLLREMSFKGSFLYKLAICTSNQSTSGEETIEDIVRLVKKLGPDQLDRLTNFLLRTRPGGNTPAETYPYLTAMTYLLERGTDGEGLSLVDERFGTLQSFLLTIEPRRAVDLIMEWKKSGQLLEILEQISRFLQTQEPGAISSLTREILAGDRWGNSFVANSLEILSHDPLMYELEAFLKPELGRSLADATSSSACFGEWLNRRPAAVSDSFCQPEANLEESPEALGAERLETGLELLSHQERQALIDAGLAFLDHFSTIPDQARYDFTFRMQQSLEQFWQHNQENSRYLVALLQMVLNSNALDFAEIKRAAATLLEPNYAPTLNKLRAKLGESMLQEELQKLLVEGGLIAGCQNLTLPGLAQAGESFASLAELFQDFLSPHPACADMPPLLAAASAKMGVFFHTDCVNVPTNLPCIPFDKQPESLFQARLDSQEDAELQAQFLSGSLVTIMAELQLDPYYLQSQNLAAGPVDPAALDELLEKVQNQRLWSVAAIVELDQWLQSNRQLRRLLVEDFVERLLRLQSESIAAMGQQFNNLVPSLPLTDFTSEYKAARVFAGVYHGGPYEWQIKHDLQSIVENITSLPPELNERLTRDPAEFALFLQRLKDADAIFKNPSYAKQNEDIIRIQIHGSTISDYLGFDGTGQYTFFQDQMVRPRQNFAPSLDPEDENWALWDRSLYRSGLIAKDIPAPLAKDFENWAAGLYGQFFEQSYWLADNQIATSGQTRPIDPHLASYFQSQSYETWETRAIAIYLLQHYYKTERLLPPSANYSGSDLIDAALPFQGFMNASYLSSPFETSKPWSIFVSLFPEVLKQDVPSYESLRQQLLPQFAELDLESALQPFFEVRGYGYRRNISDFDSSIFSEPLKLFSSLNLLTFTQDRSAAFPQPVVGFGGKVCAPQRNVATIDCPIEVAAGQPLAEAYQVYQSYVQANLDQVFCPLSDATLPLAQAVDWQKILGFSLIDVQNRCNNPELAWQRYQWDQESQFPAWAVAQIAQDIFQLGKNPELKPALQSLPAQIRWFKLQQANQRQAGLKPADRALAWLQTNGWQVHAEAAGKARYRQQAAATLWSDQPATLNYYLSLVETALPTELYEIFLIEKAQTDPVTGQRLPLIEDLLELFITLQEKHANLGNSGLQLLLDMQGHLTASPTARLALIHNILHLNSLQSYDFLARDLPLAMLGLFGSSFDWQDPGLLFAKQLIARPHLAGMTGLSNRLTSAEFQTGIDLLQEQLNRFGGPAEQERVLRIFLKIAVQQLSSYTGETSADFDLVTAKQFDKLLAELAKLRFDQLFHEHFHRWIGQLTAPLTQLDGRPGPSLRRTLGQSLDFFLTQASRLVRLHWQAETSSRDDPYFWSNLALDMMEPIEQDPAGSQAFSRFLADPRLGLSGQTSLLSETLINESSRQDLVGLLDTFELANQTEWLSAARQTGDLLRTSRRFLAFADERMIWHEAGSQELAEGLRMLRRFGEDEGDLWDKQLQILDSWFDGIPQDHRLRLIPESDVAH